MVLAGLGGTGASLEAVAWPCNAQGTQGTHGGHSCSSTVGFGAEKALLVAQKTGFVLVLLGSSLVGIAPHVEGLAQKGLSRVRRDGQSESLDYSLREVHQR